MKSSPVSDLLLVAVKGRKSSLVRSGSGSSLSHSLSRHATSCAECSSPSSGRVPLLNACFSCSTTNTSHRYLIMLCIDLNAKYAMPLSKLSHIDNVSRCQTQQCYAHLGHSFLGAAFAENTFDIKTYKK